MPSVLANGVVVTAPDQSVNIRAGGPPGAVISTPDQSVLLRAGGLPGVQGKKGPKGDKGDEGDPANWTRMTQAEYDALIVKDPQTLYVIIG